MERVAPFCLVAGFLLVADSAIAAPAWQVTSFTTSVENAPKIAAAVDKLVASPVGKEFPGHLFMQARIADGADPATSGRRGEKLVESRGEPGGVAGAEADTWRNKASKTADWSALIDGFNKNSEFLGSIEVREVKEWGSASVSSIVGK